MLLRFKPAIQIKADKRDSSNVFLNVFFKSLNTAYTNAAITQILPFINVWDTELDVTTEVIKACAQNDSPSHGDEMTITKY